MGAGDRICFRLKLRFPMAYQPDTNAPSIYATATDISTSGMGFMTAHAIPKDSVLKMELHLPGYMNNFTLHGRVMNQREIKHGKKNFFMTGIRFEDPRDADLDIITKFIVKKLRLLGPRVIVFLAGILAITTLIMRGFFYSSLQLFKGTSFGKEWLDGIWTTPPYKGIAAAHMGLAIFGLLACLALLFLRKNATPAVTLFALLGLISQIPRCLLKFNYLFQGPAAAMILLGEIIIFMGFLVLILTMLFRHREYEQIVESMDEDTKYAPSATAAAPAPAAKTPPKEPPSPPADARPHISIFRP